MGYRDYKIIQDEQGLTARTKATNDFNASIQKEFEGLKKQQIARANANQKTEAKKQKLKMDASNRLNKKLTSAGLNPQDPSAPSSTKAVIKQIKDQYYQCAMNPSEECSETMAYLDTLPSLISAGIETQGVLSKQYASIGKKGAAQGEPNSLDLDRLENTNFIFGEEFANNGGKNVKCNYDPKTKEIYWTIPGTKEAILDENGEIDEDAGYIETLPARMNNQQLIESQVDPNNPIQFFPTHGDPASIVNIMHDGDKETEIPGLGEGLENNVLTITNEVKDSQGNITEETEVIDKPEKVNEILRKRVNGYDFSNTLNSSTAVNLYGNALKKNITKLDEIKNSNKKSEDLNQTERRLMETWYGTNWIDNLDKGTVDVGDVFAEYEKNGTAGFGPYIGDEQGEAAESNIVQWQRNILSNGLILDYEKQFIVPEPNSSGNLPDENDPNISATSVNLPNPSNGDTDGDGHLSTEEKEAMAAGEVKLKEADATGLNF